MPGDLARALGADGGDDQLVAVEAGPDAVSTRWCGTE